MQIDDLITRLSDEKSSITDTLLKTKVLLSQLESREPVEWVNDELNGYGDEKVLPSYRIVHARVLANISNRAWRMASHPIPTMHLAEHERKNLELLDIRDPLSVVEKLSNHDKKGSLQRPLHIEFNRRLSENLGNRFHVEQAWCEINKTDMGNINFQVRSRLLDYLLELKKTLGPNATEQDVKNIHDGENQRALFQNTVFGANATIVVGNNQIDTISNTVVQGDFASLSSRLKKIGIDDAAIAELHESIEAEKGDGKSPSFAGRVGAWIAKQTGRAATGAIAIGVDKLTPDLIDALRAYFEGMH